MDDLNNLSPAPSVSPPSWFHHLRALARAPAGDALAAREALRAVLAAEPEACRRVPEVARVARVDEGALGARGRRPADAPGLFRVALPADGADAALVPVDPAARRWVLWLREGLDPAWEVRLLVHATVHRLLGHVRGGDPFGHWDRVVDLERPARRWDREVGQLLVGAEGEASAGVGVGLDPGHAAALARFVLDFPGASTEVPFAPALLPIEPWLHQVRVARELVEAFPRRFLLCDEEGLGKVIEAGLAIRELVHRGFALLLVPGGVHRQWREEMSEKPYLHFVDPTAESARRLGLGWPNAALDVHFDQRLGILRVKGKPSGASSSSPLRTRPRRSRPTGPLRATRSARRTSTWGACRSCERGHHSEDRARARSLLLATSLGRDPMARTPGGDSRRARDWPD